MASFVRSASFFVIAGIAACSGGTGTNPSGSSFGQRQGGGEGVSGEGGTKPPDGAPGACCPVSMGGCARVGGYTADGTDCQEYCDGMCNQRFVDDEHGCKKLVYDPCAPPPDASARD